MKNKFSAIAAICILIFTLNACKKPVPELALYVPKDATVVLAIDPQAIMDKIASSGITIDSLANMFTKKDNDYALRWNDIKNSGIDLSKSIYVFSKQNSSIQIGNTQSSGIIAQVNDAAKLEAFLKKERVGADALSGGKYKYIALGDDYVAGWTDKVLIISAVKGGTASPGTYSTGEGTLSQQQLTTLFTQSESSSIAAVDGFSDMLTKDGDIHFYTNAYSNLSMSPVLGMSKLSTLMEGSFTSGAISFENGKITATVETHNSKPLADILSKYPAKEIDKSMITKFPGDISAFGIASFNPKILIDILHYIGFDTMANNYISQMGFTLDDVVNAFTGDIAFASSNFVIKQNNMPGMNNMAEPDKTNYILAMRIANKDAFDKVMKGLADKHLLSKNGDQYELGNSGGHSFVMEYTGNDFVVGSSDELIKSYEAGTAKSDLPADADKAISGKAGAFYLDINSMLKNANISDTAGSKVLAFAQSTFKNVMATGDKTDGKTVQGNFTLNFINTSENSLASLAKFIDVVHEEDIFKKQNQTPIFLDSIPPGKDEPGKDSQ